MSGPIDSAPVHAELGWPGLPIWPRRAERCACGDAECRSPGKHPLSKLVPHGLKDASMDRATSDWWARAYPDANFAVVTGPLSGLLVLDIDGPEAEAALVDLEHQYGPLPDLYPMQWTGGARGGWQAFFQYPQGCNIRNSAGRLGRKIDVRGDGGYCLVPPSMTKEPYRWAPERDPWTIPPEPAPAWLIELLDPPEEPERPHASWKVMIVTEDAKRGRYALKALESELALVAVAPKGRRNDQLNASAHALFRFCASGELPSSTVARGLEDAARHAGLTKPETISTLKSAARARGVALHG